MDTYSLFRAFADSWMLLAMTLFYFGVIIWVFRPGARKQYDDSAQIPLRNDTPVQDTGAADLKKTETA